MNAAPKSGDELERRLLERLAERGDKGASMGWLVDRLVEEGGELDAVELALWRLLQTRRVTPLGFVRRELRAYALRNGDAATRRSYEFVLIPWSPERDR